MYKQKYERRQAGRLYPLLRAVTVLLSLGLLGSLSYGAGSPKPGRDFPRFRLELAAGFGLLDPADLNLLVDSDKRFQEFSYEAYYDYLRQNNLLRSWSKEATGKRHEVKTAILPGLRLKYFLFDFLAVSAGFQYLRGGGSQDLTFTYTRNELTNEQHIETLVLAPYRLTAEAELASIGLHLSTKIGRKINAEGFLAAGLMWAACRYQSSWAYTWVIQGPNYTWTPYESSGRLEMDGSGMGFFWETGARLELPLAGGTRSFLEAGYARQVVDSLSGGGRELQGQSSESWEGEWQIQKESVTAPWGTLGLRTPSNRQQEGVETEPFRLDLSGFRLRLGLSFAF
jgi:hypothetical protein